MQNKYLLLEFAVLVVISLIPLFWFQKGHILLGLDSGYSLDHIKFFQYRMNTWMPNPNFGVDMSAEMGLLPLVALPAIISYVGVSVVDVQKVLLVGWFFVLAVSSYLFFRELFPKRDQWIARLTGVFIYLFNFHLYSFWLQGEQPMLASYAILPLFTLLLYRFAAGKTRVFKTAVLLNIVYLFFSSGGIRGIPLIGPVILSAFTIFCYFAVINWKKEGLSFLLRFVYLGLSFLVILVPLNGYWIFPFLSSFSHEFNTQVTIAGGIDGAISWAKFVSFHDSFLNLFRLQGDNNWYFFPFLWSNNYLENPFLILASFVFPVLAFAAPVLVKEKSQRRIILLFSLLALLSLFFAAGAHAPFGEIYAFMMKHIPGFATFRSAYYKFMPTVYFSFAVLIGFTVYSLLNKVKSVMRVAIGILFLVFILIYNYPFFQNTNAAFNKPFSTLLEVPSYVTDFERMINSSQIQEKTLVVPQTNRRNTIKEYTWGYYGAFSIFALMTDKPFVQFDAYLFNDSANTLINALYSKLRIGDFDGFNRGASATGIKYVLLTSDVAYNYKVVPIENPSQYEKILSDKRYFKKIWSRGKWTMYEILDSHIERPVNVLSSVSVISPDASELDSYFDVSRNSFVLSDQISPDLLNTLPKKEELTGYPCISCKLLNKEELPDIPHSNVLPGSLLYALKLKRDEDMFSQTNNPAQKVDLALGLSLKRAFELNALTASPYTIEELNKFILPAQLTFKYWTLIDEYLKHDLTFPDYDVFKKIHRYARVNMDALSTLNSSPVVGVSPNLSSSISHALSKISEVDSQINTLLTEKDWTRNFIFKIDKGTSEASLLIGKWTLDNPSMPGYFPPLVSHEKDTESYSQVAHSPYFHNTDGSSLLSVELQGLPALLTQERKESLAVPGSKKECLAYSIANYRWDKQYFLSATALDDSIPKTIYVKMAREYFQTQDASPPDKNFFIPDFTFDPVNKKDTVSDFEFQGQPNDKSASVYLCTNIPFDPALALANVTLREEITPHVYIVKKNEKKEQNIPEMTYEKINDTKYIVQIKNAKAPFIISLLQTNSPNWKVYIHNQEQKNKFMINGFANAWYIQEKGSYTLTMEFHTQKAFYQGILITLISLSIVVLYLLWHKLKRLKKKLI